MKTIMGLTDDQLETLLPVDPTLATLWDSLRKRAGVVPQSDPDSMAYTRLLGERADQKRALSRQIADTQPAEPSGTFASRMQQDIASGPMGYNREWVPLWESMALNARMLGKHNSVGVRSLNLPVDRLSQAYSGLKG